MSGEYIKQIFIIIFTVCCIYTDLTRRKIPNKLTFPFAALGIIGNLYFGGVNGLLDALMGMVLGFFILFIPFALKGMYAGDVKMLMAIGAIKGSLFVIGTALYMAIIGGIISLGVLIRQKQLRMCLKKIKAYLLRLVCFNQVEIWEGEESLEKIYIPYAAAIGIGAIVFMMQ